MAFMELRFQQALYGVGIFLVLFGGTFALMSHGAAGGAGGFFEALSYGFTAAFFALFSGVLIGVGATLFIAGLLLGVKGNLVHIAGAFVFSILSFLLGLSAVANPEDSTFQMLVIFFAGMAAAGAFLLSAAVFGFEGVFRHLVLGKKR